MDGQMPFLQPMGYDEGDKGQPPTNLPPRREAFRRRAPLLLGGGVGSRGFYRELLVALAANEDETLAGLVARLVEECICVALGATNLFHLEYDCLFKFRKRGWVAMTSQHTEQ